VRILITKFITAPSLQQKERKPLWRKISALIAFHPAVPSLVRNPQVAVPVPKRMAQVVGIQSGSATKHWQPDKLLHPPTPTKAETRDHRLEPHQEEEAGNPVVGIEDPAEETEGGAEDPSTEDLDEDPLTEEDGEAAEIPTIPGGEEGTAGEEAIGETISEETTGEAVGEEMIEEATVTEEVTIVEDTTVEVIITEVVTIMTGSMLEVQANMARVKMTMLT
jgi:hypothetical protein